jgi:hypothetical protein
LPFRGTLANTGACESWRLTAKSGFSTLGPPSVQASGPLALPASVTLTRLGAGEGSPNAEDTKYMSWARGHLLAVSLVLVAAACTGAAFAFARPGYHAQVTEQAIDLSSGKHYTTSVVRDAFAAQGLRLTPTSGTLPGAKMFTDSHPGSTLDDAFLVTIWKPTATVYVGTTGPKALYEKWVGNVSVSYGGHDRSFAARVAAAADSLSR